MVFVVTAFFVILTDVPEQIRQVLRVCSTALANLTSSEAPYGSKLLVAVRSLC